MTSVDHFRSQLDRVVIAAERYLDSSAPSEFAPLIAAAVAGAALREVSGLSVNLPTSVRWVMMSCLCPDSTSWLAISLARGDRAHGRPVSVALPIAIDRQICQVKGSSTELSTADTTGPRRDLTLNHLASVRGCLASTPLESVEQIYFRVSALRLPEPHPHTASGWLIGCDKELDMISEAHLDASLSQAERVVADRMYQGLGGYRPIASLLASIDTDFQESLLAARSAPGFATILDSFRDVGMKEKAQSTGAQFSQAGPDLPNTSSRFIISSVELEKLVAHELRQVFGSFESTAVVKVSPKGDIATRYGTWHGFVEFGSGFMSLRSHAVLISLCESADSLQLTLYRYVSITKQGGDVDIVIVLPRGEIPGVSEFTRIWSDLKGVHFVKV